MMVGDYSVGTLPESAVPIRRQRVEGGPRGTGVGCGEPVGVLQKHSGGDWKNNNELPRLYGPARRVPQRLGE